MRAKTRTKRRRRTGLTARRRKGGVRRQRHRGGFFYPAAIVLVCNRQPLLQRSEGLETDHFLRRTLPVRFPIGSAPPFGLVGCRRVGKLACFPAPHEARSAHAVVGTCSSVKRIHSSCFVKDAFIENICASLPYCFLSFGSTFSPVAQIAPG